MLLLLAIIYAAFISLGLPDSLLGSAWPVMHQSLRLPLSYGGIVSFIIAGGTIISGMMSARILKYLRTEKVILISVLMTAAALMGFSQSKNLVWLIVCAVPLGLGAGAVDAALNNYVAVHYTAKHMSWLHCFWGIGATVGPIIMAHFLGDGGRWNIGYVTISIIQFSLSAVLFVSLPLWKKVEAASNDGSIEESRLLSIREAVGIPGAKAAFLTFFCYCTVEATTGLWGSSFLVTVRNIAPEIAAAWVSLYYFGITSGRFFNGFASIKFTEQQVIRTGLVVLAVGILFTAFAPVHFLIMCGFYLIGLGCAPIFPSLIHETPTNFGRANSQSIMGLQMASAYVGTTFMPPLFGFVAARTGYQILPLFLGVALVGLFSAQERLHRVCKRS